MSCFIVDAIDENIIECASILCQEYNGNILNEGWCQEDALRYCSFYFKLQPDLFNIAMKDGKVIGFIFAYIKPWAKGNCLMLEELCVKKEFRKKGIAKELLKAIVNKSKTVYNIVLIKGETYGAVDEMPFSWYKRIGFEQNRDTYLMSGNPEIVLKRLN